MEHCVDETPDDGAAFGGEEDEEHVHGGDEAREVTCGHYAQQRLVDFGEGSSVVGEKGRFSDAEVRIENRHHRLEVLHVARVLVDENGEYRVNGRRILDRWQSHRATPKDQSVLQKQILVRIRQHVFHDS